MSSTPVAPMAAHRRNWEAVDRKRGQAPSGSVLSQPLFIAGDFPASCNLPTGLGKTSVVAIWLIALTKN